MKIWPALFSAVLAISLTLSGTVVQAKRLGGGSSFGKQSPNVTQRQASPGNSSAANAPARPAAPAPVAPKKPWGAMLGGLAAGLGIAALFSALGGGMGGLGGIIGQVILFALLAVVVMAVFGFVMRKFRGGAAASGPGAASAPSPFAFQGAAGGNQAATAPGYNPEHVGNDASARPWERSSLFEASKPAVAGSMIGSALLGSQSWGVPAGFDTEGFLKACKANFVTLQDAWDRSDIQSLRTMMTDDMLEQIKAQLADHEVHAGTANKTEVVMLNAQLLGIEELSDVYMASVEFSGMIREDASAGASPFREVWNMTKPRNGGSGWLVAGVQALQ